jgi:hypothetical protein
MDHRHLKTQFWSAAAVDSVLERGDLKDWRELFAAAQQQFLFMVPSIFPPYSGARIQPAGSSRGEFPRDRARLMADPPVTKPGIEREN